MAASIPHLDLMIAFVGSVGCASLTLIFPPIIEVVTLWPDHLLGRYKWRLVKDILIFAFGLTGFVMGTGMSLYEMIMSFRTEEA